MPESNSKCKHIVELSCPNLDENRLCPDNCPNFVPKYGIVYEVVTEKIDNQEQIFEKKRK
jgi:hypothetical protein